jgi:hypothetical protein
MTNFITTETENLIPKVFIPKEIKIIPINEILITCKKAILGDYESWAIITKKYLDLQVDFMKRSSMDKYETGIIIFENKMKAGMSFIDIIDEEEGLTCDDTDSIDQFIWAIRRFTNKPIANVQDYISIIGKENYKKHQWVKTVYWLSVTETIMRSVQYALNHGMTYPQIVSKMRYNFFGYPENKIYDYDTTVTMNEIYKNVIRYGVFFGGNISEYGEDFLEYLSDKFELSPRYLLEIKSEFDILDNTMYHLNIPKTP